jgi:hypothetical protein
MAGDNILARPLVGVSRTVNPVDDTLVVATTAYTNSLLIPQSAAFDTSPVIRFDKAAIDTTATGSKVTHGFQVRIPYAMTLACRVRIRLRWRINASSPVGALGRFNADILKSGVAITNLLKSKGPPRALDAAPASVYTETLVVDIPAATNFSPGDTLDLRLDFEVTTGAAGATLGVGLFTDPDSAGAELYVECDNGVP